MTRQNEPPAAWRLIVEYGTYRDAMEALTAVKALGPERCVFFALRPDGSRSWTEADDAALDDFFERMGEA